MILVQKQKYAGGLKSNGPLGVSGTKLAEALGIQVYTPKIKPKYKPDITVLNYGCSYIPWLSDQHMVINKPEAITRACNKIETFKALNTHNIPIPFWCKSKHGTDFWFNEYDKPIVFCRTLLSASKGAGIVVARSFEEVVDAPLYTLYIPKKEEYRFHIAFNRVIHIQKKLKLTPKELEAREIIDTNPLIRNSSNGYVFSSNINAELDEDGSYIDPKFFMLTEHSIHAVQALGLDFGAVDLIVGKDGKTYVLEVNTAPGIEGVTINKYVSAIQEAIT
jgi:hypothetical protein